MRFAPLVLLAALAVGGCRLKVPPEEQPPPPEPDPTLADLPPLPLRVGELAPDFVLADLGAQPHRLAEQRGRIVVLEWFEPDCTFVHYGYTEGALGELARRLTTEGVVWWAINSTAPGKPGSDLERNRRFAEEHGLTHPILLDPAGEVALAFGAERAPQLFVLDVEGRVVFSGPIDDAPFGKKKGGGAPTRYVLEAIEALRAGRPVPPWRPEPRGCALKLAHPPD